jgi:flagellin
MKINNLTSTYNTDYYIHKKQQEKAAEKIASGRSINRAADNAAGLAVAEMLAARIGGIEQALRNTQDGVSMVQTAEGALGEDNAILNRMRELSVQAANGIYTDEQRNMIQREMDQLKGGINDIARNTSFNNKNLLDGSTPNVTIQTGPNELQNMRMAASAMNTGAIGADTVNAADITSAGKSISSIDQAIARVTAERTGYGAYQNGLEHTSNSLSNASENQIAAESRIRDANMEIAIMEYNRTSLLQNFSTALGVQVRALSGQVLNLLA